MSLLKAFGFYRWCLRKFDFIDGVFGNVWKRKTYEVHNITPIDIEYRCTEGVKHDQNGLVVNYYHLGKGTMTSDVWNSEKIYYPSRWLWVTYKKPRRGREDVFKILNLSNDLSVNEPDEAACVQGRDDEWRIQES